MKKVIIMALLAVCSGAAFGQYSDRTGDGSAVCKRDPDMPKGAKPAWPKSAYTPTQDPSCPPCYTYTTKHGLEVMECPFLRFAPEKTANLQPVAVNAWQPADEATPAQPMPAVEMQGDVQVQRTRSYTGNYPASCRRDPDMPRNAKAAWPKSAYIPTGDPSCPPCYEYTTRRGLKVMECPYLRFLPEHKNAD